MTQPHTVSSPHTGEKVSIYLGAADVAEIHYHAKRLNRSLSWVIRKCIKVGLAKIKQTAA